MALHPLAGKLAPRALLVDVPSLISAFFEGVPDPAVAAQRVSFGTSGHRGSALQTSFNQLHVQAITHAVCEYRASQGITGPLLMGMDTHALSRPAQNAALQVLAAHGVHVRVQRDGGATPTPVISHAILAHNRSSQANRADGVVITPSHNPPQDGGFKYNPPHGGPAAGAVTSWIEGRANELLADPSAIRKVSVSDALAASTTEQHDFVGPYVDDLGSVIDMDAIASARPHLGVDPLGGAGVDYWEPIAERYGLDITVVNPVVEPDFRFMTVDRDGKLRMDCSSPHAMASLVRLKDSYDLAFGNDPDADRHGIVTPSGLMNPNHYLAVAIEYLLTHRQRWSSEAAVGKTLVSSAMIDHVVREQGRKLREVPVGFKWFVGGLLSGDICFGGEESAGASLLRRDGTAWSTDKDGIVLNLLAAEILAVSQRDPQRHYEAQCERFGAPVYERLEAPASVEQKAVLKALRPEAVKATTLAGDPITARLTRAPGNDAAIGGLKVTTERGWFAARPSGTEAIYKIYTESFAGPEHLAQIQAEAQQIVSTAFADAGA